MNTFLETVCVCCKLCSDIYTKIITSSSFLPNTQIMNISMMASILVIECETEKLNSGNMLHQTISENYYQNCFQEINSRKKYYNQEF